MKNHRLRCRVYNVSKIFFYFNNFFLTLIIVSVIIAIEQGQNLGKLTKKTKETKMKILNRVAEKKTITQDDIIMAMDYMAYCGIDESEANEYADSFLEECYHETEEDTYEPNDADKIPMATMKVDNGFIWYTYNGQTIIKYRKKWTI